MKSPEKIKKDKFLKNIILLLISIFGANLIGSVVPMTLYDKSIGCIGLLMVAGAWYFYGKSIGESIEK